jgi:hypothetical protein
MPESPEGSSRNLGDAKDRANEASQIKFIRVPYSVFTDPSLRPTEKLAIGRLLLYAGRNGKCYPSQETIARELCLKPRQVRNVLRSLRKKGWLCWDKRAGTSNVYVIRSTKCDDIVARKPQELCASPETPSITGKVGIRLPGSVGNALPTKTGSLKDASKEIDIECPTTNPKGRDSPSELRQYPALREALHMYFREPGQKNLYPSDRIVVEVMHAAGGATEQEVMACLKYLYNERGLQPGTRNGPRHWSWFPTVVADYFGRKREREEAANPSGYYEWKDRNLIRAEREELERMTEAIEI